MEDYLEEKPIEADRLIADIRKATLDISMTPVLCGSAFKNKGVQPLLDAVIDYLPSPLDVPPVEGLEGSQIQDGDGTPIVREASDDEPFAALAFKVMADPYVGKLTYFRVYSGKLERRRPRAQLDHRPHRARRAHPDDAREPPRGAVEEVYAGDIAAGVGLKQTSTGDTLCRPGRPGRARGDHVPGAGRAPLDRAEDQGRPGEAVGRARSGSARRTPPSRCAPTRRPARPSSPGMGELHLEVIVDRLKREFKVEAAVGRPQVAYRETVRGSVEKVEGKFIRQTGGSGQYGVVYIDLEPAPGEGFDFVNKVKGGSRAVGVHPGRREGHRGGARVGRQGGLPDGGRARHAHGRQVPRHRLLGDRLQDRRLAGAQGGRASAPSPVLLEPIMAVEVVTPQEFIGDVIGDLSRRRGHVEGQEPRGNAVAVKASVPLSAMFGYATDLRSSTQGRATYTMQFDRYDEVPQSIAEEIVEHRTGEPVGAAARKEYVSQVRATARRRL